MICKICGGCPPDVGCVCPDLDSHKFDTSAYVRIPSPKPQPPQATREWWIDTLDGSACENWKFK